MNVTISEIKKSGEKELNNGTIIHWFKIEDDEGNSFYLEAWGKHAANAVKEGAKVPVIECKGKFGKYLKVDVDKIKRSGSSETSSGGSMGGSSQYNNDRRNDIIWMNAVNAVASIFSGAVAKVLERIQGTPEEAFERLKEIYPKLMDDFYKCVAQLVLFAHSAFEEQDKGGVEALREYLSDIILQSVQGPTSQNDPDQE